MKSVSWTINQEKSVMDFSLNDGVGKDFKLL